MDRFSRQRGLAPLSGVSQPILSKRRYRQRCFMSHRMAVCHPSSMIFVSSTKRFSTFDSTLRIAIAYHTSYTRHTLRAQRSDDAQGAGAQAARPRLPRTAAQGTRYVMFRAISNFGYWFGLMLIASVVRFGRCQDIELLRALEQVHTDTPRSTLVIVCSHRIRSQGVR